MKIYEKFSHYCNSCGNFHRFFTINHVEKTIHDVLIYAEDIDIVLRQNVADHCNNTHSILTNSSNNQFHDILSYHNSSEQDTKSPIFLHYSIVKENL